VNLLVNAGTLTTIDVVMDSDPIFIGLPTPAMAFGNYSTGPSPLDITDLVTWSTSNGTIAMASSSAPTQGFVTGLRDGTVDVIATRGGVTGTYVNLTVMDVCIQSIALSPDAPSVPLGSPITFRVTGLLSDGSTVDLTADEDIGLTSSDPSRLPHPDTNCCNSVPDGLTFAESPASGGSAGTVTVTADGSALVALCPGVSSPFDRSTVTVVDAVLESVTVEPGISTLMEDEVAPVRALGHFSDGGSYDLTQVAEWRAYNPVIAFAGNDSVDQPALEDEAKGKVGGLAAGTAVITATVGSFSGSAVIQVVPP
jgi:hypothetical protein